MHIVFSLEDDSYIKKLFKTNLTLVEAAVTVPCLNCYLFLSVRSSTDSQKRSATWREKREASCQ
jgi:hypothetical protein